MAHRNGADPASALTENEVRLFVNNTGKCDGRTSSRPLNTKQATCARLTGSDTARACGITVVAFTPVLVLCRRLIEAGINPDRPLHCYRDDVLCLTVRAVAEGAALEINGEGNGFRPRRQPDAAPPVRSNDRGAA